MLMNKRGAKDPVHAAKWGYPAPTYAANAVKLDAQMLPWKI